MRRPRPVLWSRAHPRAADIAFAAVITLLTMLAVAFTGQLEGIGPDDPQQFREPDAWGVMLGGLTTAPLAWRRRRPIAVLWATVIPQFIFSGLDYGGGGFTGPLFALYAVGAHAKPPQRVRHGVAVGGLAVLFTLAGVLSDVVPVGALIGTAVLLAAGFLVGDNMRRRRERRAELIERAERAERERELLARQRVTEERTRIARELHDVVAHSVSVMVIQAAAARRQLAHDPAKSAQALEVIEANGRQAMDEMRRVLGVLRSGSDEPLATSSSLTPPAPASASSSLLSASASSLPSASASSLPLASSVGGVRSPVATSAELEPVPSLHAVGDLVAADPYRLAQLEVVGSLDGLPAGVDLSAYRVVQEALTNARKHAGPGARTMVSIARTSDRLRVEVVDDGRGASVDRTRRDSPDDGFGLIGMRERVAMCGGSLDVGPRRGGGWRVCVEFPLVDLLRPARSVGLPGHADAGSQRDAVEVSSG